MEEYKMSNSTFVSFLVQRILDGKLSIDDIPDGNVKEEVKYSLKELGYSELTT